MLSTSFLLEFVFSVIIANFNDTYDGFKFYYFVFFPKTVFRKNLMFKLFSNFQFEVQRKNELKLKFKIQSMKV